MRVLDAVRETIADISSVGPSLEQICSILLLELALPLFTSKEQHDDSLFEELLGLGSLLGSCSTLGMLVSSRTTEENRSSSVRESVREFLAYPLPCHGRKSGYKEMDNLWGEWLIRALKVGKTKSGAATAYVSTSHNLRNRCLLYQHVK